MNIKTVTVIGASGTMGANVAGIFASFGGAKVYCVGRDINKIRKIIPKIIQSVRADAIQNNLIPCDYSDLEDCVSKSDLIFESATEDFNIKKEIAKMVGAKMRSNAISCTGTSGLSISKIALSYPEDKRSRFFGVHMFNPPYNMSLCELIPTKFCDANVLDELRSYLANTLYRTVVVVKDSPAFLGNRIGFQFINEALQYSEKYRDNGGIDYIDSILGSFTGRAMPPLVTSDFVGLDVHKAIVDNIYSNTKDNKHDTFALPTYVEELIANNQLGKKTGAGLYKTIKYDNGFKRQTVFDINTKVYRDVIPYAFPFAEKMKDLISTGDYEEAIRVLFRNHSTEAEICCHFLLSYIVYSLRSAEEVGSSIDSCDDVMATGFNWCPPIALLNLIIGVLPIDETLLNNYLNVEDVSDFMRLMKKTKKSKYDYRRYFKSGR